MDKFNEPGRRMDACPVAGRIPVPDAVQTHHISLFGSTQLHRSLAGGDKGLRSTDRWFEPQRGRFCSFGEGL